MTMIGSPWDVELDLDATDTGSARPEWFGRLVDLHVLTLHGDDDAALEMARWSADALVRGRPGGRRPDPAARQRPSSHPPVLTPLPTGSAAGPAADHGR
jgi:hypothetical protein